MARSDIPPYLWKVWLKGKRKPIEMTGFDEEHIRLMSRSAKVVKIKRMPEPKENDDVAEHLGPKGAVVHQPADHDKGFKILKEWVDSIGGPPEKIRKKLRELFIDYDKPQRKTTIYSARKRRRY